MAAPQQSGLPSLQHYWSPNTPAHAAVVKLAKAGVDYSLEDLVCDAWSEILHLYFPNPTVPGFAPQWSIQHARSLVAVSGRHMHVVAAKKTTTTPVQEKDCVWVVCKPPSEANTQLPWQAALAETVELLDHYHPNHGLYVIIALGMEYMKFYWDGPRHLPSRPYDVPILIEHSMEWHIDERLKVDDLVPCSPYMDPVGGELQVLKVLNLDFWTRDGTSILPKNAQACQSLETLLFVLCNSPDRESIGSEMGDGENQ